MTETFRALRNSYDGVYVTAERLPESALQFERRLEGTECCVSTLRQ